MRKPGAAQIRLAVLSRRRVCHPLHIGHRVTVGASSVAVSSVNIADEAIVSADTVMTRRAQTRAKWTWVSSQPDTWAAVAAPAIALSKARLMPDRSCRSAGSMHLTVGNFYKRRRQNFILGTTKKSSFEIQWVADLAQRLLVS